MSEEKKNEEMETAAENENMEPETENAGEALEVKEVKGRKHPAKISKSEDLGESDSELNAEKSEEELLQEDQDTMRELLHMNDTQETEGSSEDADENEDDIQEVDLDSYDEQSAVDDENSKKVIKEETSKLANKVASIQVEKDMQHGLVKASRKEKRQLYGNDHVIPIKDEVAFDSAGDKRKMEFLTLVDSYYNKKPLSGIMTGTKTVAGRYIAIVRYGQLQVLIPAEKFIKYTKTDREHMEANPEQQDSYMRYLVNQRLNSEVDFIVEAVDEKEEIVFGNRVKAMENIFLANFFGKDRSGNFLINEGDLVEARIVFSSQPFATLEVFGKEVKIRPKDISYRKISDVAEELAIGDTVPVKITGLKRGKTADGKWDVNVNISIKEAFPDTRAKYYDNYEIDGMYVAEVTQLDATGIYARLEGCEGQLDVRCNYPKIKNFIIPPKKSKIAVRIYRKVDENFFIYGNIIRVLKYEKGAI